MTAPNKMAKRAAAGTLALAVCLGGGILGAGAAQADASFAFDNRVAGADRIVTAVEASKDAYPTSAGTVIVVNDEATVDGLTASYAAGLNDAPILYVKRDSIPAETAAEITRLGATKVIIVGGTSVVSAGVETSLKSGNKTVTRLSGADRYATAAAVATSGTAKPGKVFIANGNAPADALAAGPIAFAKKYPVLLTQAADVPSATSSALNTLAVDTRVVLGGNTVVSTTTYSDLKGTTRLGGANRQETATLVAGFATSTEGFAGVNVGLVGPEDRNTADALIASPLLAKQQAPLLFTARGSISAETSAYLKANAAKLTGEGYVFGGEVAVPSAIATEGTNAAGGGSSAATFTVLTEVKADNKFTYADPATKKSVEVTYTSSDSYTVDGASSSLGAFEDALSVGDSIAITKDSPSAGKNTYALTNKTVLSGMVGNEVTTLGAEVFDFIDPVTGGILANVDYTPAAAVYSIDGASATLADFNKHLNEGDSLVITGGDGAAGKTRTFALTNTTVTGTIASNASGTVTIKTAAGATLGNFGAGTGESITIDGAASTEANFATAATVGDAVSYKKVDGVETITLTNAAPASITGTYQSINATTDEVTYFTGSGTATGTVDITSFNYKVNGSVVTLAEFKQAATAGDEIVFQGADTTTDTKASIVLTDKPVSGKIGTVGTSANTAQVLVGDTTAVLATIDYSAVFFADNTVKTYYVNGVQKSFTQFDAEVEAIGSLSRTGSLTVTDNGSTTEFRVTSTAAAATLASVTAPAAASTGTTLTVTFNNPVYLSSAAAASDFVVTVGGAPVAYSNASPSSLSGASTTVTLTIASTTFATGNVVSVQLTETGAAKFLDVDGKAAVAKIVTATV